MKPLRLDFAPAFWRQRPGQYPRLWLAGGGVVAGLFLLGVWAFLELGVREFQANEALRLIELQIKSAIPQVDPATERRLKDAREARFRALEDIAGQLKSPWEELLATLESPAGPQVTLLALSSDSKTKLVRISLEAKSVAAAFEYVDALRSATNLHDVSVLRQETFEQDPNRPVRLAVEAKWHER